MGGLGGGEREEVRSMRGEMYKKEGLGKGMSGEMQGMRVKTDERREDLVGRGMKGDRGEGRDRGRGMKG